MTYPFADDAKRLIKAFKEKYPDKTIYIIGWEVVDSFIFPKTIYTNEFERYTAMGLEYGGKETPSETGIRRECDGQLVRNYIVDRGAPGSIPDGIHKSWITLDAENKVVGYVYRVYRPDHFIGYMVNKNIPPKIVLLFDDLRTQLVSKRYGFQIKTRGRYGLYVTFSKRDL